MRRPTLKIVPIIGETRNRWEADYKNTVMNMVMGAAPTFGEIIAELEELNERINKMR